MFKRKDVALSSAAYNGITRYLPIRMHDFIQTERSTRLHQEGTDAGSYQLHVYVVFRVSGKGLYVIYRGKMPRQSIYQTRLVEASVVFIIFCHDTAHNVLF